MARWLAGLGLAVIIAAGSAGISQAPSSSEYPVMIPMSDPLLLEVLKKINSVNAYEIPNLGLKKDSNYAATSVEVEPFRGVVPFKEHFLEQLEYTGPGRAIPEPEHVATVKIGFIGPIMSTVSVATGGKSHEEQLGIKMLQGARLAIEQANARGGYLKRKIPFELAISNDNGLWGASGNEIIKMAYRDGVWAILGTIDGANTHIAIRVALKAELVMLTTGDTDPTYIETNIPWVGRAIGDDRQQGYLLVDYLYRKMKYQRVGIIRASNRYGRFGVREINDGSRRLGFPIAMEMAYKVGSTDFSMELGRLKEAKVDALVHWGDAQEGALVLNQMRKMGMDQPFFCSDRCVQDEFIRLAGENAEGVICAYPWNPDRQDPKLEAFRRDFSTRYGENPETYAAHAYDGMNMLIWAIQAAGLNRAKIRDVIAYLPKPWPGVTGDIPLSACLDDVGDVFLAKREGGKWKYYSREELVIPRGNIPPRDRISRIEAGTGERVSGQGVGFPPFYDAGKQESAYNGPGREDPEPIGLKEVRIGYFGPSDPKHPEGGDLWLAVNQAIEEANAQGGYRGLPFRLIQAWAENPWSNGAGLIVRMAYVDRVWAVIGGIDGVTTHLAETVVAKARVTLISPGSTDKTVNLANVPWMFSALPGDHLLAPALGQALLKDIGNGTFVVIASSGHDSHLFAQELDKYLSTKGRAPAFSYVLESGKAEDQVLSRRVMKAQPAAIVVVADARSSAQIVNAMRRQGFKGKVFGGPAMGRRSFQEGLISRDSGVYFAYPAGAQADAFSRSFAARHGFHPDYAARCGYETARLLVAAVRRAGLNRARIRDAVRDLSPWQGVAAKIEWDGLGRNRLLGMEPPISNIPR
jgi:branched-chain amino acid transport system substrate-binding protein